MPTDRRREIALGGLTVWARDEAAAAATEPGALQAAAPPTMNAPAPSTPLTVGIATATRPGQATLLALSDRLGWEAANAFDGGTELSPLDERGTRGAIVLDGRLGHNVPTVVVLVGGSIGWGAGSSWERAYHRGLYGAHADTDDDRHELSAIVVALASSGIAIGVVRLGTRLLEAGGVHRCRVQLLVNQ